MSEAAMTSTDVLGAPFELRRLRLRESGSGPAHASLVRLRADSPVPGRPPLLYVHGFVDYFFQSHVAHHFAQRGRDFYALDLRAYGRSLLAHQTPNDIDDLAVYAEELDAAVAALREDGHMRVVVMGHSTGGLITPLWAHDRGAQLPLAGLILNSPWLELAESALMRTAGTWLIGLLGRFAPRTVIRPGLGDVYGRSIHRDHDGEWEYSLDWKPLNGFPIRAGWLRAIRQGHARVHRGLDVSCPILVLRSSASDLSGRWGEAATRADTVLDVQDMSRYAPRLGRDVQVEVVPDALHDVFLSRSEARERAFAIVDRWLGERVDVAAAAEPA